MVNQRRTLGASYPRLNVVHTAPSAAYRDSMRNFDKFSTWHTQRLASNLSLMWQRLYHDVGRRTSALQGSHSHHFAILCQCVADEKCTKGSLRCRQSKIWYIAANHHTYHELIISHDPKCELGFLVTSIVTVSLAPPTMDVISPKCITRIKGYRMNYIAIWFVPQQPHLQLRSSFSRSFRWNHDFLCDDESAPIMKEERIFRARRQMIILYRSISYRAVQATSIEPLILLCCTQNIFHVEEGKVTRSQGS